MVGSLKLSKQVKIILIICLFFFCWFGGLFLISLCKGYFYAKERAKENKELSLAYNASLNSWPSSTKPQTKRVVAVSPFKQKAKKTVKPTQQSSLLEKTKEQLFAFFESVPQINFSLDEKKVKKNLLKFQPQQNKIIINLDFSNITLKNE